MNFKYICLPFGGLAQLARALPWHGRGHRFDSDILHKKLVLRRSAFLCLDLNIFCKLTNLSHSIWVYCP